MRPTSYECIRCGMAVPVDADRCPSCRARVREQEVVVPTAVRTGPAAAEAWARVRGDDDPAAAPRRPRMWGDVHDARPVGPGAAAAYVALRLVELAALAVVAVQLARSALALAVEDADELTDLGWWDAVSDLAVITVIVAGGAVIAAAVLLARWASAAGHNVRALALDPRRWLRSGERVVGRLLLVVGLLVAWWVAPSGPDRADRAIDLGLGVVAAVALVVLASAAQRLLLSVTATELERAELLTRIESAAAVRPRHR